MKQKSTYRQKKLSSLTRDLNLPIFTANETITNLTQYELSQKESDLLKAGLYFSIQPDKIRKSLPSKRFIVRFLTTLNPRKPKARQKRISRILLVLIFTTTNLLHVYYLNIASYEILGRINILF